MPTISQGRVIAESDRERIAAGLRKFEAVVGPPLLDALSWMVKDQRTGILWVHLHIKEGDFVRYKLEMNFTEEAIETVAREKIDPEPEIIRFNRHASGEILRVLSDSIVRRESGWIHPHMKLQSGRLTWLQYATDFGKPLDERD